MTSVRDREDAATSPLPSVPRLIVVPVYALVVVAALILLTLHTIGVRGTHVDTTSLGLLTLLLLVPLAPHIRRFSAAGVEAEIGRAEARRLQETAAELPSAPAEPANPEGGQGTSVQELIARDPPLGLAKLRIELEGELRRLIVTHEPALDSGRLSAGLMARRLTDDGVIPSEVAAPLADVTALANRAIHGEYVPADVATDIARVGLRVLGALQQIS